MSGHDADLGVLGQVCDEVWIEEGAVGLGERRARDLVLEDVEALKEGLIEEAALSRSGVCVGRLDVAGQVESEIEGGLDLLVAEAEFVERLFGVCPVTLDTLKAAIVDALGDLSRAMALQQIVFLVIEPFQLPGGEGNLALGDINESVVAVVEHPADAFALCVTQLHRGPVAHNRVFDEIDRVVALAARLQLLAAADEVVVDMAVATGVAGEHQASSALAAVDRAFEVVVVDAVAFAGEPLGVELLLDALE